jgi:hypothetical protein
MVAGKLVRRCLMYDYVRIDGSGMYLYKLAFGCLCLVAFFLNLLSWRGVLVIRVYHNGRIDALSARMSITIPFWPCRWKVIKEYSTKTMPEEVFPQCFFAT